MFTSAPLFHSAVFALWNSKKPSVCYNWIYGNIYLFSGSFPSVALLVPPIVHRAQYVIKSMVLRSIVHLTQSIGSKSMVLGSKSTVHRK